jgi:hypothetical protein
MGDKVRQDSGNRQVKIYGLEWLIFHIFSWLKLHESGK